LSRGIFYSRSEKPTRLEQMFQAGKLALVSPPGQICDGVPGRAPADNQLVVTLIETQQLCEPAEPSTLDRLAAIGQRRVLRAGVLLMRQFDPPGPMYVLQSGMLRVLRMQPCGDVLLARIGEGAHVGELSALLETPRSATVQVLTEAVVQEISTAQMRELIRTDPAFARTISENLVERAGLTTTAAAALIASR
jgi:CRP-like cAMP-binding protein